MRTLTAALAALTALFLSVTAHAAAPADAARLPWRAGESMYVTQDCNDSCCGDHVGHNGYAWDFASRRPFTVTAPRAGTVVHVKMSSDRGGPRREDADAANYVVLDHGDGTYSVMLHLAQNSLDPSIRCGSFVRAGQPLATSGSTGWSTGNHLHYQVNRIPPNVPQVCECGDDGMACGENEAHWDLFWSYDANSCTVPARFAEWPGASSCSDRHEQFQVTSRNVDAHEEVITVSAADRQRFVPLQGAWSEAVREANGGTFRRATNGGTAMLSLDGLGMRPGKYEVWQRASVRRGAASARTEIVARSGRTRVQGERDVRTSGGFKKLPGSYTFSGLPGEGVVLSGEGNVALGDVLLRRVSDADEMPGLELRPVREQNERVAVGGGPERTPGRRPVRSSDTDAMAVVAVRDERRGR